MIERNPFEALCLLAAQENWCWKIVCTTCGHMHFRYGFRELSRGKHPESSDWRVRKGDAAFPRGAEPSELGQLPSLGGWLIQDQRALASVLLTARLGNIRSEVRFPDWLGYLGLGLYYCERNEKLDRSLTKQWVPQLIEMLPQPSRCRSTFQEILNDPTRVLGWRDLEMVESNLIGA